MCSIVKVVVVNIKKGLRVRLRKSSLFIVAISALLLATFLLIQKLPTGFEKQIGLERNSANKHESKHIYKEPIAAPERAINPKFLALRDNLANLFPAILPSSSNNQQIENPVIKPLKHHYEYGDEYAHFTKNLGNYEDHRKPKTGRNGDLGEAFHIDKEKNIDKDTIHSLKNQYGMNIAASQLIPMDRSVPDIRLDECKYWHYTDRLPSTSVVVVFHNEGLSTLMRTVHSILLRSPRKVLREVLLVDDYSDKKPLKAELENYIEKNFGIFVHNLDLSEYSLDEGRQGEELNEKTGKVRLIRNAEREGLIRARSRGAKEAVGDVIVFLDAHCEVNHNWLPPLLAPIAKDNKSLTVPIIDGIDSETFKYRPVYSRPDQHFQGIWEWGMYYKEIEVDMQEHLKTHKVSEPYESPTHAGGLFAISKSYFLELGTYDPGLLVWGGENFELSFKVWQCGGRLLWVPCSRVGHVYRPFMPYNFGSLASKRKGPLIITNYKRVIEVWWDKKFKDYFYTREPLATWYDPGNINEQMAMKEKLQCKSFEWFMDRIGNVVYKNFPPLPPNVEWGELRSIAKDKCLDTFSSSPPQTVILADCHSSGGNQLFRLNAEGQLGTGERCIDADDHKTSLIYCKLGTVNGPWSYDVETHQMRHSYDKCLKAFDTSVKLAPCDEQDSGQKWTWKTIKPHGY